MKKGLLITFEGLDGSGKTTQIREFIDKLEKNNIHYQLFREPGGTKIGEKIREILLDKNNMEMSEVAELLLYSASRNQLSIEKIRPALENNKIVICDRFYDSTTAYQGYARKLDMQFIRSLNWVAADQLIPDITFLLDISLEERTNRFNNKNLDRLEQEEGEFHRRVRNGFLSLAEQNKDRFFVINGNQSIDYISNQIWSKFREKYTME